MIDNPAYKGVWKPQDIPNPDYVKDPAPLTNIGKVRRLALSAGTPVPGMLHARNARSWLAVRPEHASCTPTSLWCGWPLSGGRGRH